MNRAQTVKGRHLGLLKTGGLRVVLDVNAYYMFIPMIMVICKQHKFSWKELSSSKGCYGCFVIGLKPTGVVL